MPPIPVYSDAPIIAAKPDGITPQTAAPNTSYPAAAPGAAAVPAPTGVATPSLPQPSARPPPPTPTRTQPSLDGPPPPQPGAVPLPPSTSSAFYVPSASSPSPLPPPPQPSDIPSASVAHAPPTTMPPQFGLPPPTPASLPTHSTTTGTGATASSQHPTTLNLGPVPLPPAAQPTSTSLNHPPGYQQNPYAADGTSAQRASLEAAHQRSNSHPFDLAGVGGGTEVGEGVAGAWEEVKKWTSAAGKRASRIEEDVWRRLGKE
ncbi:hypothetical protein B0A49_02600 [Cryomyces minteri]|uniref:Uncharacterized protein n=1 Tax=Cryomyces minteri TaxID=331657 RepID=A0A4V5NIU5_9PEZI|nr:hypothetical protein B0A49_02600 [Cryomyces minteri]